MSVESKLVELLALVDSVEIKKIPEVLKPFTVELSLKAHCPNKPHSLQDWYFDEVGCGDTLEEALNRAYQKVEDIMSKKAYWEEFGKLPIN